MRKTKIETLAAAMDVLAREIKSDDGAANAAIAEAAERLRELNADSKRLDWLNQNGRVAKMSNGWNAWLIGSKQESVNQDIRKAIDMAAMPNGQKLRQPEPAARNHQKAHSQIRSANEGLPPALC